VGRVVRAGLTYEYGRVAQGQNQAFVPSSSALVWAPEASFHDVAARMETFFDQTDTRVAAYCRFNALVTPEMGLAPLARHTTRYDVQISQGLPFLGTLTRADWDLLVAFRNLFYDTANGGGVLDEVVVANPPKRLLGGISVRF